MRLIDADKLEPIEVGIDEMSFLAVDYEDIKNAPTIEPCEDAISREWIKNEADKYRVENGHILRSGLFKAIDNAPSVAPSRPSGEWVPCSERLPEEHRHYLCTVTRPQYIDRIYTVECYWCGRWYGWLHEEVTAWMPLPAKYQGE